MGERPAAASNENCQEPRDAGERNVTGAPFVPHRNLSGRVSLQQTASIGPCNGRSFEQETTASLDAGRPCVGVPVYLQLAPEPVLAFLHRPVAVSADTTGVLLCPPFGWEEIVTYRTRRAWAERLALAGHPALRIDLPGTADSLGSPREPARLEVWTKAVSQAAEWLRVASGCQRVAAIGIGLGGVVATMATADGAPIDDLVLWNVPARGRKIVRELRAFTAVSMARHLREEAEAHVERPDVLDSAGRIMTAETVDAVAAVDLTSVRIAAAEHRRVLMLGRDSSTVDQSLCDHLVKSGADVTVISGDGYAAMMTNPRLSVTPSATIARSIDWLSASPRSSTVTPRLGTSGPRPIPEAASTLLFQRDGQTIRETAVTIQLDTGHMFGILCEPAESTGSCVSALFLSEGAARRLGPSGLWVETARRWAARGVPTLRLDQPAIGDSDGDEVKYQKISTLYGKEVRRSTASALDAMEARGLPGKFVVVGLCSGAYWSVQGALTEERIVGCFAINPPVLVWRRWTLLAIKILTDRDQWLGGTDRIVSGRQSRLLRDIRRWARRSRPAVRRAVLRFDNARRRLHLCRDHVGAAFDKLRDEDKEVLLVMSRGELLTEELIRNGQASRLDNWPNLRLDIADGTDHAIRPVDMQRHVSRSLDAGLSRVLARHDTSAPNR